MPPCDKDEGMDLRLGQCSGMTPEWPTLSVQMRGKLTVMRVGAVLLVGAVAVAAGAVWIRGAIAASRRGAPRVFQDAESPSWSPDGRQVVFTYIRYKPGSTALPLRGIESCGRRASPAG